MLNTDDNLDELMEAYSSPTDIRRAMRDKQSGEPEKPITLSEKLKKYPKPERELDLHNKTVNEAQREIGNFLINAKSSRIRTVRIITGKGLHSQDFKSVLPETTEQKLAEFKRTGIILNFKKEKTGGSFIVYLV
jgi:DNA-nicking Smr family endonuclease